MFASGRIDSVDPVAMISRMFVLLYLSVSRISCDAAGLTTFPAHIAEQASAAAFNYAWAATNERMGPQGGVAQNQLAAANAVADMKKKSKGLLSEAIVDEFKWLAFNAGWCAANRRNGVTVGNQALLDQANANEAAMNEHYDNLKSGVLLDEVLVSNLKWMAWRGAWYAANTRDGNLPDDAKKDKAYFDDFSKKIMAEVRLLSIDFDDNAGKVAAQKPLIVADQVLDNLNSSEEQSMAFQITYTEGRTDSWSTTLGFKIGVSEKIEAG